MLGERKNYSIYQSYLDTAADEHRPGQASSVYGMPVALTRDGIVASAIILSGWKPCMTLEEEFKQHQAHQRGINSATAALLQLLIRDLAFRIPVADLNKVSHLISAHRHSSSIAGFSPQEAEAYSRVFDAVEASFVEVQEERIGRK